MFSFFGGGHGGHPQGDGLNHGNAPISTATIPPVGNPGSGLPGQCSRNGPCEPIPAGPGRHRGGLGAVYEIELLEEDADLSSCSANAAAIRPSGVAGGGERCDQPVRFYPGRTRASTQPPMASKMVGVKLQAGGQRVRLETPGGGGYGPPEEREPSKTDGPGWRSGLRGAGEGRDRGSL